MQRLVLIDDSVDTGELVAAIGKPLGYACEQATTFAAFKALRPNEATIVVVDLIMPDVDGIQVLRYLGAQKCRAGILLLSGAHLRVLSVAEEMARSLGLQVLGRLPKPFERDKLEAILRHAANATEPAVLSSPPGRLITKEDMQGAINGNQLVLHSQPQIDIRTGAAAGTEALIRWQHPVLGLLFPDTFIGQCESWNLIDSLTWAVVDIAFNDAKMFSARGWTPTLSINVSALSLHDVTLPDRLLDRARTAGVTPARIVVEITESGMIRQEQAVLDTLARLRLHGFSVSIDDFGTGFSMMHQLKRVPANEIKIDKAFVSSMDYDQDARIIVRKTIEIGHEMGMKVVAEGVETQAQLQWLAELDCDLAQGYLFARPMPAADTVAWQLTLAAGTRQPGRIDYGYRASDAGKRSAVRKALPAYDLEKPLAQRAAVKSLLIIDDGPEIAALVSAIAKPLGYSCDHALTFGEFKTRLAKAPTLIVVDLQMPDVDGIEVLRYLGKQQCQSGILLLSRVEWSVLLVAEEMARSAGLNVVGVLRKPFTPGELAHVLRGDAAPSTPIPPRKLAVPVVTKDELQRAIVENQFVLQYQPRIDIRTGTATGVEVLVRWRHPDHGLLFSDAFVKLVDSPALAMAMTSLVSQQMFKESKVFAGVGWQPKLSINVSVFVLKDVHIPDLLLAYAEAAGIAPERLVIEITDSGLLEDVTVVLDILARLRLCGFNLSIDDFGAGFSMMHQLKRIPANEIKVDKVFIRTMHQDPDATIIVRKTIEIGQEMGMTVVAKGVETQEQLQMLREMNCEMAQGTLFSRPMAAAEILAWREKFEARDTVAIV